MASRLDMRLICVASMLALTVLPTAVVAQDSDSRKLVDILSELRSLHREVEAIANAAKLLPATATPITVDVSDAASLGAKDAKVALVEFTDYQCQYCRQFAQGALKELSDQYLVSGKVRLFILDLPLDSHPGALLEAQAANCAARQRKFWEMKSRLEGSAQAFERTALTHIAADLQMDGDAFATCLSNPVLRDELRSRASKYRASGATGTPSFLVGRVNGGTVFGELLVGLPPFEDLSANMEALLAPPTAAAKQ